MITLTVDPQVAEHVRLGLVEVRHIIVRPAGDDLRGEIAALGAALRDRYAGRDPAQIEELQPGRDLYKRMGIDPARLRPSAESLLRRVLRGEEVPATNAIADTGTLCSLDFLLPVGLYDLNEVRGALVLRRGRPIEMYEAIGKAYHSVEGRLVLADETGPCGSPTADALRTMITPKSERCLMVIYAPSSVPPERMTNAVRVAADRMRRHSGGTLVGTAVLPAS